MEIDSLVLGNCLKSLAERGGEQVGIRDSTNILSLVDRENGDAVTFYREQRTRDRFVGEKFVGKLVFTKLSMGHM